MTQQQGIRDIMAALEHHLTQLERDARKWEATARGWEATASVQRKAIATKDELLRAALAYEIEHNGVLGEQQDRLRSACGLPPVEPMSTAEWLTEMRERYGHHFDGVDPVAYVRELRDDDEPSAALDAREGGAT